MNRQHAIDLIGQWQRTEQAADRIIELARLMVADHIRGMAEDDPHKGIGNRLADAIGEYDASLLAQKETISSKDTP